MEKGRASHMARVCSYLTAIFGGAFFGHLALARASFVGEVTAVETLLGLILGVFLTSLVLWVVAVKLLHPGPANTTDEVERFHQEILRHLDEYLRNVSAWVNQAQSADRRREGSTTKKE